MSLGGGREEHQSLSTAPKEIDGHGLLAGKVVLVTAAAGTGIGEGSDRLPLIVSHGWLME